MSLTIDHQPGWFYYQYSFVHPASGIVLSSGNVSAWDSADACRKIADIIIKKVKAARPIADTGSGSQKKKKDKDQKKE